MKRRVLLIYPESGDEVLKFMPLSLLHVSRPLVENRIPVEIIDQRMEKDFFNRLSTRLDKDLICIGISCITGKQIKFVLKILRFLRNKINVPLVLGGPHPTILPEQTLRSPLIDYVVIGSGEVPFLKLINVLKNQKPVGAIAGLGYKINKNHVINKPDRFFSLGYKIPYQLVGQYTYPDVIPVVTSHGCHCHCAFCLVNILHPVHSYLTPKKVLYLLKDATRLKHSYIDFFDDNFLSNLKWAKKTFRLWQKHGLQFDWICDARVDSVLSLKDSFLTELKNGGLKAVFFGIESGSNRILKLIKKGITTDMVTKLNLKMKNIGIGPHYSFMSGFPGETKIEAGQTLSLIDRLKQDNPKCLVWKINKYIPYPKTPLFELAVRHGFDPPGSFEEWADLYFHKDDYGDKYGMLS